MAVNKRTNITKAPQVFLREVQLENDGKTLLNHHRLLHAWMAELRSASPTTKIGENGWTPRYIVPAHDKVVARLKELIPGFNHETPIQASMIPALVPITVRENAVRVIEADADGRMSIVFDREGDWVQTIAAALGQDELRVFSDASKLPVDAPPGEPAYHLVLMPVDEWTTEGRAMEVAARSYDKLTVGIPHAGRLVAGLSVLRAAVVPGMSLNELNGAAREARSWVLSGASLPPHVAASATLAAASATTLVEEAERLFREMIIPVDDTTIVDHGLQQIRQRAPQLVEEFSSQEEREFEMRRFVRELVEGIKE